MPPQDTTAEVWSRQIAVYRNMTGEERVEMAIAMSAQMVELSRAGIRSRHPEYDDDEVEWAARRLRIGDDLFRGAWPAAPVLDP